MAKLKPIVLLLFLNVYVLISSESKNYYELLGIGKDADNREIRRAFKKLALTLHPDKHPNDPKAHDTFININKAYEVLKDEELRKKYDLYGEDGLNKNFQQDYKYKSWKYYQENFGIYDDDKEIITLSQSDFSQSVLGTSDKWFINFYSPYCSHCHDLAPNWRTLAREFEGVIRFGAVNCEEDWILCRQQDVNSYPSLLFYPKREKYYGDRTVEDMTNFIINRLDNRLLIKLTPANMDIYLNNENFGKILLLIFFCEDDFSSDCPSDEAKLKLATILNGVVNVAALNCIKDSLIFSECGVYLKLSKNLQDSKKIQNLDIKEILNQVIEELPKEEVLDHEAVIEIRNNLKAGQDLPWLIHFVDNTSIDELEFYKLSVLLPEVHIGKINCNSLQSLCAEFHIHKFPTFSVLKTGHGYENYHGRLFAQDIAVFARDSIASNVESLGPKEFSFEVTDSKEPWFIDFFAPWCPPCMKLLPEWRKAARSIGSKIRFGTVDCTVHQELCNKYNIKSYPTTVLYNQSNIRLYRGDRSAGALVEFLQDMIAPSVKSLTLETFNSFIGEKPSEEMWIVDFFAPWCGPCQQLAPQLRKMSNMISSVPNVHVAEVDCVEQYVLCDKQGITSYPTIRLYPVKSKGQSRFNVYDSWNRDAHSIRAWVFQHLPSIVTELGNNEFYNEVIYSKNPFLVDFYSPWCSHCHTFAPDFELVAKKFEGKVSAAKINCEQLQYICQQAGIRAYPTVRFYPGASNIHSGQSPYGIEINNQQASKIIEIVETLLKKASTEKIHDEL